MLHVGGSGWNYVVLHEVSVRSYIAYLEGCPCEVAINFQVQDVRRGLTHIEDAVRGERLLRGEFTGIHV